MKLMRNRLAAELAADSMLGRVRLLWAVAGLCFAWQLLILYHWMDTPIIDEHGFRQSQTAITAYWLMQGGPFFAYQTPVLGAPWSIPFELPVYQAIVALVAQLGVPLDEAGRLVSEVFFLGLLWPLQMLWRDLRLPPAGLPIACALLLASPMYAFWSRTFMIESSALTLSALWLALLVRFVTTQKTWIAIAAIAVGLLAAGTKATTLPPFALLGAIYMLQPVWRWLQAGLPRREWASMILVAAILFVPFIAGFGWVAYADSLKAANPIGRYITSATMVRWNWGTLDQRWSYKLWQVILNRATHESFGVLGPIATLLLAGAILRRELAVTGALVAAFLSAFFLFPNLHIVHTYYQYANDAFILVAVAVALGTIALRWPAVASVLLLVLLAAQTVEFHEGHWRSAGANMEKDPTYRIAQAARALTPEGSSLLILGEDWSSVVPYYAHRKALAVPGFLTTPDLKNILKDPQAYLEGSPLAGVVSCTGPAAINTYSGENLQVVDAFLAGRKLLAQEGDCHLLLADDGGEHSRTPSGTSRAGP